MVTIKKRKNETGQSFTDLNATSTIDEVIKGNIPKKSYTPTAEDIKNMAVQANAGTPAVTQADLDALQRKGINVFDPHVLQQLSLIDKANATGVQASTDQINAAIQQLQNPTAQTQADIANIQPPAQEGMAGQVKEAGLKSGVGLGAGLIGGAIVGSGGTAAIPIAAAAGVAGLATGIVAGLNNAAQKNVASDYQSYTDSLKNIKAIISTAGQDPVRAVHLYQIELAKIDMAERMLKMSDEKDWLSTSKKQLTAIQDFNSFQRDYSQRLLLMAIADPTLAQNFDFSATPMGA